MNYGQGEIYGIASTPARLAVRELLATPKSFDRPISVRLMNFQPIERANIAGHSKGSGSCIGLIRFVPLLVFFFFIDFELGIDPSRHISQYQHAAWRSQDRVVATLVSNCLGDIRLPPS
jgi:hypothetical protein